MRVNKIKMKLPRDLSETELKIPIKMSFNPSDQAEVVEREFVSKEMDKSINPITDYEQGRFEPIDTNGNVINTITYNVNLLDNNNNFPNKTNYGDDDFTYDDIRYRKNRFKNSFLRLVFYDSDITTNQNVISLMTLYSRLDNNDLLPNSMLPKPINQIPIRFTIKEPVKNPESESEGYHVYHNISDVVNNTPKYLYMRASWNNSANSKSTGLITDPTPQTINNLIPKLHMRYILTRGSDGYYYKFDETYSNNITISNNDEVNIELYEIQVL